MKDKKCNHNWKFTGYGRDRSNKSYLIALCSKCGKVKEKILTISPITK